MFCFFVRVQFLSTYIFHFPLLGAFLTGLVVGFLVKDVRKGAWGGLLSVAIALFLFVTFSVHTYYGKMAFLFFGVFYVVVAGSCGVLGAYIARKRFGAKLMTLIVLLTVTPATLITTYDLFISPTKPITHSGDLIIDGNQTFTIKSCVYTQEGNIIVKDNASLVIKNAKVIMDQSERSYFIDIKNYAELIAENASITVSFMRYGPHYSDLNFSLRNHAQATIKGTWISSAIQCYDSSQISVYNSTVEIIDYRPTDG